MFCSNIKISPGYITMKLCRSSLQISEIIFLTRNENCLQNVTLQTPQRFQFAHIHCFIMPVSSLSLSSCEMLEGVIVSSVRGRESACEEKHLNVEGTSIYLVNSESNGEISNICIMVKSTDSH